MPKETKEIIIQERAMLIARLAGMKQMLEPMKAWVLVMSQELDRYKAALKIYADDGNWTYNTANDDCIWARDEHGATIAAKALHMDNPNYVQHVCDEGCRTGLGIEKAIREQNERLERMDPSSG